ncbi:MAG TPA: nuclear transport factor 2 family protein [Telluria sp.]|nr:nuclear transport factor 2 family protein [Telluria sp.]
MDPNTKRAEAVLNHHLGCFLEQRGIDAIVADYADEAVLFFGRDVFRGKREIAGFFDDFISGLPPQAISQFRLAFRQVEQEVAYIGWHAGADLSGTDTFLIQDGKIRSQTVYLHGGPA